MTQAERDHLIRHFKKDRLAALLGIELVDVGPGSSRVRMRVAENHLNSVDITHGGAIFSMADYAFAIAGNSYGRVALAMNVSVSFLKATVAGTELEAEAVEQSRGRRTALYLINVKDGGGRLVASMQGTVYIKDDLLPGWPGQTSTEG